MNRANDHLLPLSVFFQRLMLLAWCSALVPRCILKIYCVPAKCCAVAMIPSSLSPGSTDSDGRKSIKVRIKSSLIHHFCLSVRVQ